MVLTINIFIDDQTTVAIIFLTISTIKRQSLSFLTINIFIVDQTTVAIIFLTISTIKRQSLSKCNIETISNSRDYYSRFNQLELQNIKSN